MIRFLVVLIVVLFGFSGAQASDTQAFLSILPDVPLMEGLVEIEDSALSFDKPEGRIVLVETHGDVQKERVIQYYQEILPQLGWKSQGKHVFVREDESLNIQIEGREEALFIKFLLEPR